MLLDSKVSSLDTVIFLSSRLQMAASQITMPLWFCFTVAVAVLLECSKLVAVMPSYATWTWLKGHDAILIRWKEPDKVQTRGSDISRDLIHYYFMSTDR